MCTCTREGDTVRAMLQTECSFDDLFAQLDPLKWDDMQFIIEQVVREAGYIKGSDGGWTGNLRELGNLFPFINIDNLLYIDYRIIKSSVPRIGVVDYSLNPVEDSSMSLNTGQLWVWEEIDQQGRVSTLLDFSKAADFSPDLLNYCENMCAAMHLSVNLAATFAAPL